MRYSDRPTALGARLFGLGGACAVFSLMLAVALFKWSTTGTPMIAATLSVFEVAEPQAPPVAKPELPPTPEQVRTESRPPEQVVDMPPPLVEAPGASSMSMPVAQPPAPPGPPVEQASVPEPAPMPPGAQMSDAKPTWEGRVLAALNRAKRYPREANRNRQQGAPLIRFVMDRAGRIRSVRLERPSNFDALDREALALPYRAQPLPKPPEDVAGERIELVVPVEFFL